MRSIPVPVVGILRSRHRSTEDTPIQAALKRAERGTIEIDPLYQDGLDGLDGFRYAWLITWLHDPDTQSDSPVSLRQTPYLLRPTGRQIGVFATRGPRRINPIGQSLIEIVAVRGHVIEFAGVDVIDGTPVIDLKPYVQRFDRPPGDPPCGWFDDLTIVEGMTPAALGRPDHAG